MPSKLQSAFLHRKRCFAMFVNPLQSQTRPGGCWHKGLFPGANFAEEHGGEFYGADCRTPARE